MTAPLREGLAAVIAELGGQEREGQIAMAEAIERAIDTREHLLVQAGTGTGKSVAYLVPAILHAIEHSPVIVATATLALQRQLMERDLPRVSTALTPLLQREPRYAVLKGRNNYVCLERLNRSEAIEDDEDGALFTAPRSELGRQARAVQAWAETTETGDRDEYPGSIDPRVWRSVSVGRRECVGESKCRFGEECFTVKRREIAMKADVVITNHALLAIDVLEGIPVLPEHDAVIIDEAHELVDRATQALTMELSPRGIEFAAGRARKHVDLDMHDALLTASDDLADALAALIDDGQSRLPELTRDLTLALTGIRDAARAATSDISTDSDPTTIAARQRARGTLDEIFEAAGKFLSAREGDVIWVDPGPRGTTPTLHLAPLHVAGLLRSALFSDGAVVLTSATLTVGGSFDSLAQSIGLADPAYARRVSPAIGEEPQDDPGESAVPFSIAWQGLDVGSPFDYERQGILYVAAHLPPPSREGIAEEALDEIADLIDAAGGRTLVLCSSWKAVERLGDYLRVRLTGPEVMMQAKGDTVADLVDRFTMDAHSVLVGTLSLWQGVDVPGDACTLVVIDRIPFPRPDDPVLSARQAAVDAAGGSGFRSVSVPRAGLLLAQGAGRLIRGLDDRGVVAVLDPRLATAGYARLLRQSLPPFWYTTDKDSVLGALRRLNT